MTIDDLVQQAVHGEVDPLVPLVVVALLTGVPTVSRRYLQSLCKASPRRCCDVLATANQLLREMGLRPAWAPPKRVSPCTRPSVRVSNAAAFPAPAPPSSEPTGDWIDPTVNDVEAPPDSSLPPITTYDAQERPIRYRPGVNGGMTTITMGQTSEDQAPASADDHIQDTPRSCILSDEDVEVARRIMAKHFLRRKASNADEEVSTEETD